MIGAGSPFGEAPQREMPWLITLADLMGLMLAFFVMLFAMSEVDQERWQRLFGAATAETVPMSAERQDRDASLTAELLAAYFDADYLAVLLRDRLAEAGARGVSVEVGENGVVVGFDRLPRLDRAADGMSAILPLLRRLPVALALSVAVGDPAIGDRWQTALDEADRLAAALGENGAGREVETLAIAARANGSPISLLVTEPAGVAP